MFPDVLWRPIECACGLAHEAWKATAFTCRVWEATHTFHRTPQHIREHFALYIGLMCVWHNLFLAIHCQQPMCSIWVYFLLSVSLT